MRTSDAITPRACTTALLAGLVAAVALGGCGKSEPNANGAKASAADIAAGKQIFETKCMSCHTVGQGKRVGPDLAGVTKRRKRAWIMRWVTDPITMGQTDPTAKKLVASFNQVQMPPLGLSKAQITQVLAYIENRQSQPASATKKKPFVKLTGADFATAKSIYFNRCAGCHGTLRAGATGPCLQPKITRKRGTETLVATITHGTPGGMPAWGDQGILSPQQVGLMARYVQMDPPEPPQRPLADIKKSWSLKIPPKDRPTKPQTTRNWQNYFGVVLRDKGQIAIIDGDTHELVDVLDTGFAVHIARSSSTGRYFYVVGRDGRVTMVDLWTEKPSIVAQVQGCFDARSVDGSKFQGYEDKYLIEGCYWPPQYVVYDGQTLEPLAMHGVLGNAVDTGKPLKEVRVASIVASHSDPVWVAALKESGHVGIVDYSKPGFPLVKKIPAARFLHDGGWDHTGRYFMVAANMSNKMVVVDVKKQKLAAIFETGVKPHPGRGANWQDPKYGWVNATTHIGQGLLAIYGADPQEHPEYAWKVVRKVKLPATGSLFLKTHPSSPWVWMDFPLSNEKNDTRKICVYSKAEGKLYKCWQAADHGRVVHFEYNEKGDEVWVSVWDKKGELIIYDDKTLAEKQRITGDWLVTPTGKFNVYNTSHDIY